MQEGSYIQEKKQIILNISWNWILVVKISLKGLHYYIVEFEKCTTKWQNSPKNAKYITRNILFNVSRWIKTQQLAYQQKKKEISKHLGWIRDCLSLPLCHCEEAAGKLKE